MFRFLLPKAKELDTYIIQEMYNHIKGAKESCSTHIGEVLFLKA